MTARATIGGVPLANATGVAWALVSGVVPYTTTVAIHKSDAGAIDHLGGKETTLRLESSDGRSLSVSVWVLREAPSPHPHVRCIVLSDVRWRWPRIPYVRSMNVPRKSGDRRLVGGEVQRVPVEAQQAMDVWTYSYASLDRKDGEPKRWTAIRALEDVLEHMERWDGLRWRIADGLRGRLDQADIQGLDLAESATSALSRILSAIPRAGLYIDRSGQAVAYDQLHDIAGISTGGGSGGGGGFGIEFDFSQAGEVYRRPTFGTGHGSERGAL